MVGADAALIWFGVMLCVNMQTSFLHPPFGFALFYLRGVAPKEVKSSDIYWGAIPYRPQAIMVAIVIAFPIVVTALLDKPLDVDLSKVRIEVPQIELPPLDLAKRNNSRRGCSLSHERGVRRKPRSFRSGVFACAGNQSLTASNQPCALRAMKLSYPSPATWNHWRTVP